MIKISGNPINSKIVIGKAIIHEIKEFQINTELIQPKEIDSELEFFKNIFKKAIEDTDHMINNYARTKIDNEVLGTHKLILEDPEVLEKIDNLIQNKRFKLEYAIEHYFNKNIELFKNMKNEYFAQRSLDFIDIKIKLLTLIKGDNDLDIYNEVHQDSIVIAKDITPSEIIKFYKKKISGICLEKGNSKSHSIIMAKSLGLQVFIRTDNIFDKVKNNDYIILDGTNKVVIIKPDSSTISDFRNIIVKQEINSRRLEKYAKKDAITKDNVKITLLNNLEFPDEIEYIQHNKIDGIGLFRTEFLFMEKKLLPDENEQFREYKKILEAFKTSPVIFRTIDIGGDKLIDSLNLVKEQNPNLGCRGIRLSLRNIEIFKTQLRALLRSSIYGNLKIMFPMISSVEEVRKIKIILEDCKDELKKENFEFDNEIKIGIMIEVPSTVFISHWLAKEVDFFSLGTNDLVQYNLAVDRNSENVEEYYQTFMPANLLAIKSVIENSKKEDIEISICGDAASDIDFIKILLGFGMRSFSVIPSKSLEIKENLSKITIEECKILANKVLKSKTQKEIEDLLR